MDGITSVSYFDVQLQAGKHFRHEMPEEHCSFLYLFEGSGQFDGQRVPLNTLVVLSAGGNVADFIAGEQGARFLLISGKPINEPVVQHGPFVMNTREQIDQAMRDFQSNNFVRDHAWTRHDR